MPKTELSKTQAVKNYLARHPEATARIVIPALASEGINVSQALVNNTRSRLKKQPRRKFRTARVSVARRTSAQLSADDLFEAKRLVDQLGGIDNARKALDALEQLR